MAVENQPSRLSLYVAEMIRTKLADTNMQIRIGRTALASLMKYCRPFSFRLVSTFRRYYLTLSVRWAHFSPVLVRQMNLNEVETQIASRVVLLLALYLLLSGPIMCSTRQNWPPNYQPDSSPTPSKKYCSLNNFISR